MRRRPSSSARARTAPCTSSRTSTPQVAERISASDVARQAAAIVGGGGGGRPTMARAGGKDRKSSRRHWPRPSGCIVARCEVLALDYGAARTGVAVSDETGAIARPLAVVERAATPAGVGRVVRARPRAGAERVVVGLPLTLRGEHGQPGARDRGVRLTAARARRRSRRDLRRAVHDHARGGELAAGAPEDARAAAHLLESYLARMQSAMKRAAAVGRERRAGRGGHSPVAGTRIRRRAGGDDSAVGATASHLPGRVHAARDGGARRRRSGDRHSQAQRDSEVDRERLSAVRARRIQPPTEFRKDWSRTRSSEGFLFPATYEFTKLTPPERLVA